MVRAKTAEPGETPGRREFYQLRAVAVGAAGEDTPPADLPAGR